jgi:carboxymethylenebutenolidase
MSAGAAVRTTVGPLPGLLWLPEGASAESPAPALVVLQEIFGLTAYIRGRCADLAALGYAVVAPQVYARLDPPVEALEDDTEDLLPTAMGLLGALDWDGAVADVVGVRDALAELPEVDASAVGLLGFCFGGGLAFDVAAAASRAGTPPAALVSYYGSALPNLLDRADDVRCPSLHVFGTEDAYLPMPVVEQIREAVTAGGTREDVRVELHEGGGHAFDNPNPMFHHARASRDAWAQTVDFLGSVLPVR